MSRWWSAPSDAPHFAAAHRTNQAILLQFNSLGRDRAKRRIVVFNRPIVPYQRRYLKHLPNSEMKQIQAILKPRRSRVLLLHDASSPDPYRVRSSVLFQ